MNNKVIAGINSTSAYYQDNVNSKYFAVGRKFSAATLLSHYMKVHSSLTDTNSNLEILFCHKQLPCKLFFTLTTKSQKLCYLCSIFSNFVVASTLLCQFINYLDWQLVTRLFSALPWSLLEHFGPHKRTINQVHYYIRCITFLLI